MTSARLLIAVIAVLAGVGKANAQEEIPLPGTWSYVSTVPAGKGYQVEGTEFVFIEPGSNPQRYTTGSRFNAVTDTLGNRGTYAPRFYMGQQLSPYLLILEYPGGGKQQRYYDSRQNIWKRVFTGADNSSTITLEKNFDATCDFIVSCNQPNWVRDGNANQTDYEYSNTHGRVLKATSPTVNSVRPQTRYEYQQFEARYKNSSGVIVASGQPIWLLTKEEFCKTTSASGSGCAGGAADEVETTYDYGLMTGANNLWLRGKAVTAGGVTLRTCYYYDDLGNQIAETQPNAGLTSCN